MFKIEIAGTKIETPAQSVDRGLKHATVRQLVYRDERCYVTFWAKTDDQEGVARNVIAVSEGGLEWRIAECPELPHWVDIQYGGVYFEDDELWAYSATGYTTSRISPTSGDVETTNSLECWPTTALEEPTPSSPSPGPPYRIEFVDRALYVSGREVRAVNGYLGQLIYHRGLAIVVVQSVLEGPSHQQNVLGVDQDGIAWTIDVPAPGGDTSTHHTYNHVRVRDGELWARSNQEGGFNVWVRIDPSTGECLEWEQAW